MTAPGPSGPAVPPVRRAPARTSRAALLRPLTDRLVADGLDLPALVSHVGRGGGPWVYSLEHPERGSEGLTEAAFQAQVLDVAAYAGWRVHHETDSRRSPAGLPDLVCVRPPRLVVLELKSPRGRHGLSEQQRAWLADLSAAGIEAAVAGPGDLVVLSHVLGRPGMQLPPYDPGPEPVLTPAQAREVTAAAARRRRAGALRQRA